MISALLAAAWVLAPLFLTDTMRGGEPPMLWMVLYGLSALVPGIWWTVEQRRT